MEDRHESIFTIRRYEPRDREDVWNLHNKALHDVGAHLGNGEWDDDLHDIEEAYIGDGGEFLVGERDGEIVATGALKKTAPNRAEIKRMRVESSFRGRGLGEYMLSRLEERAAELGYTSLHLDTTVRQFAARRLYEKNGCEESGRGRIGHLECVFMEKESGGDGNEKAWHESEEISRSGGSGVRRGRSPRGRYARMWRGRGWRGHDIRRIP